jgi:hypothetical protein
MLRTTLQILNDIEEQFDGLTKEHVLKHAIQGIPNYPVQLLIDSINGELTRLHMPYLIEDLTRNDVESYIWLVKEVLTPTKLNWEEKVYANERGEAVYQLLLEPFKNAHVFFPSTLKTAMELFKVDITDFWELRFYRDWLLGINTAFYPHECKVIMEKLKTITVRP